MAVQGESGAGESVTSNTCMICDVTLRYVMLRYVMLHHVIVGYVML